MERSKLKLTVIFLLVVLNLFLLGSVVLQHHQTQAYEATTRQQILLYLENHNVSVAEEVVPWETALSTQAEDLTGQLLPQQALPEEGLPADCEIQPARAAATLLMYVVQGLPALGGGRRSPSSPLRRGTGTAGRATGRCSPPCGPSPPTRGPSCWTAPAER